MVDNEGLDSCIPITSCHCYKEWVGSYIVWLFNLKPAVGSKMHVSSSEVVHGNATDHEALMSMKVVFVCLWAFGLLLNTVCAPVVGWVMWKKPSWPTILLFVLTITDAMVVVFGISVSVVSVADSWYFGLFCALTNPLSSTHGTFTHTLWYSHLSGPLPGRVSFVYNKQLSNKVFIVKGVALLVIAGLAMLVVACLPLMIGANIVPVKPGLFCFFDWTSHTTQNRLVAIVNIGITSLTVALLLFFTIATCCGIYKMVASSHLRDGNVSFTQKVHTQSDNQMEVKFVKLMVVIVILFAACTFLLWYVDKHCYIK